MYREREQREQKRGIWSPKRVCATHKRITSHTHIRGPKETDILEFPFFAGQSHLLHTSFY